MSVGRAVSLSTAIRTATRLHVALQAPPVVAASAAAARQWGAMSFGGNQAVRACLGWAARGGSGGVLQGRLAPTRYSTDGHAAMPSMQTARMRSSVATRVLACVPLGSRALPVASNVGSVVSWGGVSAAPPRLLGAGNIRGLSMSASPLHPATAESPALKEHVFAVVQINGKQYKVTESDFVVTAKLPVKVGTVINLEKVLLVGADAWTAIGTPLVPSTTARVSAIVHDHHRGAKLQVFKKKKRKGYTRKKGHRTDYTTLRIMSIKCAVPPPPSS